MTPPTGIPLGDAKTTARVFLALVPKLRSHGIRTIAEAERACLALTSVLDDQMRIGGSMPSAPARADANEP
jgi:DNA polymerase-3 subunit epsilon/CBS domain-containing protein